MAYTIYNSNGSVVAVIPDNSVDSDSTSLDLIGKNLDNYGSYINSNFFKLLTNFASYSDNQPISPQIGQLWYDITSNRLKVYTGLEFVSPIGTEVAGTAPIIKSTGDLWYDTINGQLKLWDGNSYQLIAPSVSKIYGKFNIEPPPSPILSDDQDIEQKVGILYSYSTPIALITTSSFFMKSSDSMIYLNSSNVNNINKGISVLNDLNVFNTLNIFGRIGTPIKWLTAYFDITAYGDVNDSSVTTSTRLNYYYDANNAIRFELKKLFPLSSTVDNTYSLGSEVKVICNFSKTKIITSTTTVSLVGTDTLYLSTSSLSVGDILISDSFIKKSTVINSINDGFIGISTPLITEIPQGTNIHFYEDIKSVRKFIFDERIENDPQWEPNEVYSSITSIATGTCVLLGSSSEAKISNITPSTFLNELTTGMEIINTGSSVAIFESISLITNIDKTLNEITIESSNSITAGDAMFFAKSFPFINTFTNIVR